MRRRDGRRGLNAARTGPQRRRTRGRGCPDTPGAAAGTPTWPSGLARRPPPALGPTPKDGSAPPEALPDGRPLRDPYACSRPGRRQARWAASAVSGGPPRRGVPARMRSHMRVRTGIPPPPPAPGDRPGVPSLGRLVPWVAGGRRRRPCQVAHPSHPIRRRGGGRLPPGPSRPPSGSPTRPSRQLSYGQSLSVPGRRFRVEARREGCPCPLLSPSSRALAAPKSSSGS